VSCPVVAALKYIFRTSPLSLRKSTYFVFFLSSASFITLYKRHRFLCLAFSVPYYIPLFFLNAFFFCCLLVGCIWYIVPSCPIGFPNAFIQFVFNLVYVLSCVERKLQHVFSLSSKFCFLSHPTSLHPPTNPVHRCSPTHNIFFSTSKGKLPCSF